MRNSPRKNKGFQGWYLRNAVPARGRKPFQLFIIYKKLGIIWEMQSPQGDGNPMQPSRQPILTTLIWEMQSPQGDGNYCKHFTIMNVWNIWEMQSPQGDGNLELPDIHDWLFDYLRNAVPARGRKPSSVLESTLKLFEKCSPRKGTETWIRKSGAWEMQRIWEMQSPQGDGNLLFITISPPFIVKFEKCSPRKGTETVWEFPIVYNGLFEKCSPRKGTETILY